MIESNVGPYSIIAIVALPAHRSRSSWKTRVFASETLCNSRTLPSLFLGNLMFYISMASRLGKRNRDKISFESLLAIDFQKVKVSDVCQRSSHAVPYLTANFCIHITVNSQGMLINTRN